MSEYNKMDQKNTSIGNNPEGRTAKQRAEHDREVRRERLNRARIAMHAVPRMSLSERKRVARNLWDLLDHFEKCPAKIRKAQVMVKAGVSAPEDSTKHLGRYTLKPNSGEQQPGSSAVERGLDDKCVKALTQRIDRYVALARAGAELAGEDPDDALLQLLSGTQYLIGQEITKEDKSISWEVANILSENLYAFVDRLAAKHKNISQYFSTIDRQHLVRHPRNTDKFIVSESQQLKTLTLPYIDDSSGLLGENGAKCLQRLPQIYLGSVEADKPWIALAIAEGTFVLSDNTLETSWPALLENYAFAVNCIPTWDVYLAIGPFGAAQAAAPIIILEAYTRVRPNDTEYIELKNGYPFIIFPDHATLGEFQGHHYSFCSDKNKLGWSHSKLFRSEIEFPNALYEYLSSYGTITPRNFTLSMARVATAKAIKEIKSAANIYNKEFSILKEQLILDEEEAVRFDDLKFHLSNKQNSRSEKFSPEREHHELVRKDNDAANLSHLVASGTSDRDSKMNLVVVLEKAEEILIGLSTTKESSDRLHLSWSDKDKMISELRSAAADELDNILTKPCFYRHFLGAQIPTMKWFDARNGETIFDDQMNFYSQIDFNSTPVMAPEGTLLALLERWWRGEVQNRAPLRDELEAAVTDALQRLEDYEESARESLRAHSERR